MLRVVSVWAAVTSSLFIWLLVVLSPSPGDVHNGGVAELQSPEVANSWAAQHLVDVTDLSCGAGGGACHALAAVDGILATELIPIAHSSWQITFSPPVVLHKLRIYYSSDFGPSPDKHVQAELLLSKRNGGSEEALWTSESPPVVPFASVPQRDWLPSDVDVPIPLAAAVNSVRLRRTTDGPLRLREVALFVLGAPGKNDRGGAIEVPLLLRIDGNVLPHIASQEPSSVQDALTSGMCRLSHAAAASAGVVRESSAGSLTGPIDVERGVDCAFVSALFGAYERAVKPIVPQRRRCTQVLFTDRPEVAAFCQDWKVVVGTHYMEDSTLTRHSHNFLKAKYYKMNYFKYLPSHVAFGIWVDATVGILHPSASEVFIGRVDGAKGGAMDSSPVAAFRHTRASLFEEVLLSYPKYHHVLGTYPQLVSAYLQFLQEGYRERYWERDSLTSILPKKVHRSSAQADPTVEEMEYVVFPALVGSNASSHSTRSCPAALQQTAVLRAVCSSMLRKLQSQIRLVGKRKAGWGRVADAEDAAAEHVEAFPAVGAAAERSSVYVTNIVVARLNCPQVKPFFLYWWNATRSHWQDQVSFPVALWRFGFSVHAVDDVGGTAASSPWHKQYEHDGAL